MTGRMRIAILDDYQNAATSFADWSPLDADVEVFTKPFTNADDVVRSLAGLADRSSLWRPCAHPQPQWVSAT